MMNAFSLNISSMSFLGSVKSAEVNALPVYTDCRLKLFTMFANSKKFCGAMFSSAHFILHIEVLSNISKIAKSVIVLYPVYMVNIVLGKFSGHVKPCKTVGGVSSAAKIDMNVSGVMEKSRATASAFNDSGKNPSFMIVVEQFFETFLSKHWKPFINRLSSCFKVGRDGDESSFQPLNLAQHFDCNTI